MNIKKSWVLFFAVFFVLAHIIRWACDLTFVSWFSYSSLLLFLGLFTLLMYLFYRLGIFYSIKLTTGSAGPYYLVHKGGDGLYNDILDTVQEVRQWLEGRGYTSLKGFGVYVGKTRSGADKHFAGCIIESKEVPHFVKEKFELIRFETDDAVLGTYPFNYEANIFFGARQIYRKIYTYCQKHNREGRYLLEIYDEANKKIDYILAFDFYYFPNC